MLWVIPVGALSHGAGMCRKFSLYEKEQDLLLIWVTLSELVEFLSLDGKRVGFGAMDSLPAKRHFIREER